MASSTRKRTRSSSESIKTMQPTIVKSERKTRSKRQKENYDEISSDINNKKHYVLYPGDDDGNGNENQVKSTWVLRRHTLKEQNINITNPITSESAVKKPKNTRKSKKMVESITDITDTVSLDIDVKPKVKKNKKKKQIVHDILESNDEIIKETVSNTKKKSKKKKNAKRPSSDGIEENPKNSVLNASMDSFHSAAGSPSNKKFNGLSMQNSEEEMETGNPEILQAVNKKLTPKLPQKYESNLVKDTNGECIYTDNSPKVIFDPKLNDTHNITNDRLEITDNYNKSCKDTLNSTYEKSNMTNSIPVADNTKEELLISGSKRKLSSSSNTLNGSSAKCSLDKTFEKNSESSPNNVKSLDLTIEKVNKADLTFDKDQRTSNETSNIINVTFDQSNGSLVSISSNDSRIDNLASPILINSSMNDSIVLNTPKKQEMTEKEIPFTSLKREGTYTKENTNGIQDLEQSEINTSECSNHRVSLDETPKRLNSLPSPGCTPFIGGKSSEKGKILNITHSIEKPAQKSSLLEQSTKTTRVMFCSPVSNPVVASQVKRKVIKSSLKGSNKSFLFNHTTSETRRPGTRKRSFTQNDADSIQTKRVRLVDEQQQSIDRLSRPRTVSAVAKLSEPLTPSKKTATPVKTKPEAKSTRTKLPNFAALHQKRFQKMESLDECQERKAKRARQLLTPTGSVNLLERISPKEKVPDSPKAALKETGKPDTPYRPKLFTLGSVNPGYTRFGFKLNCAVNPFTATDKQVEVKTRKTEPGLIRQATQPSLAGATSVRRLAAAKQSIMRETSFTGKRDTKRNENRTVIKGVRTNRRFDLQMQMRNIN